MQDLLNKKIKNFYQWNQIKELSFKDWYIKIVLPIWFDDGLEPLNVSIDGVSDSYENTSFVKGLL